MSWTRASYSERSLACPASTVLPSLDSPGEAAQWGKFCHLWMETGEVPKEPKNWAKLLTEKIQLSGVNRDELWPARGRFETRIAIYCGTDPNMPKAALGDSYDDDWRDKFSEEYITGEIDYWGEHLLEPHIDDLKTGKWLPALDSGQCLTYGVGVWLLTGEGSGVYLTLTHWPKYPKAAPPKRTDPQWTSAETLQRHYDALKLGYNRYKKAQEHMLEGRIDEWAWVGDHCHYCKSKDFCPKWAQEGMKENG